MTDRADVRVLHQDADLLVLWKPSGLPTTSPDGRGCLTEVAARIDPRAPRLHASSRLDAEVTGVVTFARTTRAIEGLLAARKAGQYERYYLGLAIGAPSPPEGEFNWPIERDPRDPRKRTAAGSGKLQAQDALTRYRVLGSLPTAALLLLSPMTGRTHQLRVHAARAGVPLLGDKHYGGPVRCTLPDGRVVRAARVMLHCARVRLPKIGGVTGERVTVDAPLPEDFQRVWVALGGEGDALEGAIVDV
ncbi:MAG TPA: RluA family pseudouridine synthase [Polyangiales bacterium]|nr:RluA family pseudouridine synthase [Polyangiales bacterium]